MHIAADAGRARREVELSLRAIRYGGCCAAVLLALAGWFGGALPHGDLASTPSSVWHGSHGAVVLSCWLAGTTVLAYAWWSVRDRVPSPR